MGILVAVAFGVGALTGASSGLAGTVDAPARGAATVKQAPDTPEKAAGALRIQIGQLMWSRSAGCTAE